MYFLNIKYLSAFTTVFLVVTSSLAIYNFVILKLLNKSIDKHLLKEIFPLSLFNFRTKLILHGLALLLVLVALLRPVMPLQSTKVETFKMDIALALDISPSMLATDIAPNRLQRAKQETISLLSHLPDYRMSLILFSGQSILQVPLTNDYSSIKWMLPSITPEYISNKGTNFTDMLQTSESAFSSTPKDFKKILIVITDGEDHSANLDPLLSDLKKQGITVYTIGIGSAEGVPIPVYDEKGTFAEYKKDANGNPVITKMQGDILNKMSSSTGGKSYFVNNSSFDLSQIIDNVVASEKNKTSVKTKLAEFHDLFQYPLLLALIFLLIALLIPNKNKLFILLIFLYTNNSSMANPFNIYESVNNTLGNSYYNSRNYPKSLNSYLRNIKDNSANSATHYNIGNTLYQQQRVDEAQKEWQQTLQYTKDRKLRSKVYFNRSVQNIANQDFNEAKNNLINCLKNNPNDSEAKKNLELVMLQLKNKQQNRQSKNDKNKEEKKDNKQNSSEKQSYGNAKYSKGDAEKILDNFKDLQPFTPGNRRDTQNNDKDW